MGTVVNFPPKVMSVSDVLRSIADRIDAGEYGDMHDAVFVMHTTQDLHIMSIGPDEDPTVAHYLLGCAMTKMHMGMLDGAR